MLVCTAVSNCIVLFEYNGILHRQYIHVQAKILMDLVLHIVIYIGEALYYSRGKEAAAKSQNATKRDETRRNATKRDETRRNATKQQARKERLITVSGIFFLHLFMLFIYVLCFVCCLLFVSTVLVDCCLGWWFHHGGWEKRMRSIYRIE